MRVLVAEDECFLADLVAVRAITLITEVEERTGCELDPNALWKLPTVAAFAGLLAEEVAGTSSKRS